MNKHSPGPWTIPERDSGVTVNARNGIVCEVYAVDVGTTQLANAKLIAAAPDLLEALREIANGRGTDCFCNRTALAALAKAGL